MTRALYHVKTQTLHRSHTPFCVLYEDIQKTHDGNIHGKYVRSYPPDPDDTIEAGGFDYYGFDYLTLPSTKPGVYNTPMWDNERGIWYVGEKYISKFIEEYLEEFL